MRRATRSLGALALLLTALAATAVAQSQLRVGPDQSVGVLSEDPAYGERWSTTVLPIGNYVGPESGNDVFCRTYLRFPLGSIPADAQVDSATLRVYVDDYWPEPGSAPMAVYPVAVDWTPASVDWMDMGAWPALGAPVAATDVSSTAGWYSWDVTPLINGWLAGSANNGLAVAAANLTSTEADWAAARRLTAADAGTTPYLELTYRTPQPTAEPVPEPAEPETVLLPVTGEEDSAESTDWLLLAAGLAVVGAGVVAAVERRRARVRRERG
jgi:hypothetical protein